MIRFNISYDDADASDTVVTVTCTDIGNNYEYSIERYHFVQNWYDINSCLQDFISKHIEEKD